MEGQAEDDISDGKKENTISPKVARPKLPKFSSHTLGHHYRHKTDPGKAEEIKHLMDEINEMKKWKDTSSIFDKSSIRPKVIKPQTIPKARSTHTSPRSSPPPGSHSPNISGRSSSLNRNRSRSLKVLTDKLKSKMIGGGSSPKSPGHSKSKSADAAVDSPMFLNPYMNTGIDRNMPPEYGPDPSDSDAASVEPIPEKDEKEDEDKENKSSSTSNLSLPDTSKEESLQGSPGAVGDDMTSFSDSDTPTTHVSTFTLHPIDRNSKFFILRQTAPPKRRPGGYTGVTLPKPKIQVLHRSEEGDGEEEVLKKPNKLELPGMGSIRRLSGTRMSKSLGEDSEPDTYTGSLFKSPSTESPPPFPGDGEGVASSGSGSPCDMKSFEPIAEASASPLPDYITEETTIPDQDTEVEKERQERRNGKSPKQKSKSDPSGNKSFDFDTSAVINASQSQSWPVLGADNPAASQEDTASGTAEEEKVEDGSTGPSALDTLNNNEPGQFVPADTSRFDDSARDLDFERSMLESVSEDVNVIFPGEDAEHYHDSMSNSQEGEEFHDALSVPASSIADDNISIASSVHSTHSDHLPALDTSLSDSPTHTTDRQVHLCVPTAPVPKRPILRSVSSASVFQRERKYSANSKDKDTRKHSLTSGDDTVPSEGKPPDYLGTGDLSNMSASSMPSLNTERQASVSNQRIHL